MPVEGELARTRAQRLAWLGRSVWAERSSVVPVNRRGVKAAGLALQSVVLMPAAERRLTAAISQVRRALRPMATPERLVKARKLARVALARCKCS